MRSRFLELFLFSPLLMLANPSGFEVVHGEAAISSNGQELNISTSGKAIIEWDRFSIDAGETTRFLQPTSQSSVLNRVISSNPSRLFGTLESNGKVYLINQNGIVIGKTGMLQTAAFVGSTFDVLNADFIMGGDLLFQGASEASIVNEGKIEALNGDAILIAQIVKNEGILSALNGVSGIGAGEKVLLKEEGEEHLFILSPLQREGSIQQNGTLEGLSVEIKAAGNPYALAVRHEGKIDALGVRKEGGNVFLVAEKGELALNGNVRAETVHIHGEHVILEDEALIDVSGGGSVCIGKDPIFAHEPKTIYIAPNAQILADGKSDGCGGKVILWADEMTSVFGSISATGGELGGDGGFVEISSGGPLFPKGKVNTTAPKGKTGTILLDPCAVEIVSAMPSMNYTTGACAMPPTSTCYTFMAGTAEILNSDLVTLLTGGDVIINATASGTAMSGSITVNAPVMWPGMAPVAGTPTSLTLIADTVIDINASIVANYTDSTVIDTIVLEAPTINVTAVSGDVEVRSLSGHIVVNASADLNLTGTMGHAYILTGSFTAGNISINLPPLPAGNLTGTNTGAAHFSVISADQNLTAYFNNIDLGGTSGSQLGCAGPSTTTAEVHAAGFCHVTGGTTNLGISAIGNNRGSTELTVGQDIVVTGGGGMGVMTAGARIGAAVINPSMMQPSSGNLTIHSATSITVQGGTLGGTDCHAVIGTGDLTLFAPGGDGNVSITCSGPINITGGTSTDCYGGIITNGSLTTNNITINGNNANNINISAPGGAGTNLFAGIQTFKGGNITINNFNNLTMTGTTTTDSPAIIQTNLGGNLSLEFVGTSTMNDFSYIRTLLATSGFNFFGGNLALNSMAGEVILGANLGSVNVELTGNLNIQAGTNTPAMIGSALTGGTGNVTLTAQDITLTGGAGGMGFAFGLICAGSLMGGGNGSVSVTAEGPNGISLNGGTANNAAGFIGAFGMGSDNHINIDVPNGDIRLTSTQTMTTFASAAILTTNGGNISINIGRDLIMTAQSAANPSFIANSFTGMASNDRDITIVAGRTINIGSHSNITNYDPLGQITLVVDNDFPTPPQKGPGEFILAPLGTINTAGATGLFIYTATPLQNTIEGTINGPFLGVNFLVDGPNEQWGVYYPDNPNNVTGTPYTIFYKEGYVIPVPDFTIPFSEAYQLWRTYDRLVYDLKTIELKYENTEELKKLLKKNSLSSFDLPSWVYSYFYKAHRNYNTLKLDNRL